MNPNKDLGQHWLRDTVSLDQVANAAGVDEGDVVVEIGPGLGTLTRVLLARGAEVVAVEFDKKLAKKLSKEAKHEAWALTVVSQDIREFDFLKLPNDYKVVGNIPYYLTSHIIQLLLEAINKPQRIGLLIQKEVAERAAAEPGQMSVLAISAQFYAEVSLGPIIPKELFDPVPKVDSQVLSLTPKTQLPDVDIKHFFRVVKAGFGERRKKLANSLAGGLGIDKDEIKALIADMGWDENIRAQELSIDHWLQLVSRL